MVQHASPLTIREMLRFGWMRRERPGPAIRSRVPGIVKDHGANGVNAVKHALTARAMVLLAPSSRRTLSLSRQRMVAYSAPLKMASARKRIAMTSAARCTVLDLGLHSLNAHHRAEMESSVKPMSSPSLLSMVATTARSATIRPTPKPATKVHALWTVSASGQNGRLVPRNVVVVRRKPGS